MLVRFLLALLLLLVTNFAQAKPPAIFRLSEVRPGMVGYGLTVFQGTKPEKFAVRVIGILHNFLPKEDVILIQSDDPRLLHSGIVQGMSGSPIYFDDRVAGALAYGWSFAKDPIAGVTPIENMLAELKRPLRGPAHTPMAEPSVESGRDRLAALSPNQPHLEPVAVPLSVAGFSSNVLAEFAEALKPYHLVPEQAGGGGQSGEKGPAGFEAGGPIAVQIIRGDMSAAATGTVTYIDGNKVLAFGHPMFNVGEVYLPIATARIHTFMAALSSSFKLSSPIESKGSLLQDRQTGIIGEMGKSVEMIPITVSVGGPDHVLHAEIIRHRFLTPMLAAMVIANAAQTSASDVADATVTVHSRLQVRGYAPIDLIDTVYSPDGVSPRTLAGSSGIKAIGDILFNPFTPATVDRIDVNVSVDYKADVAEIVNVSLTSDELEPGTRPSLFVTLRPYAGSEFVKAIPFEVPRALAGLNVKITVQGGNQLRPEMAPPENLSHLINNMRKIYPARALVVSVETPDEGVTLHGSVIPDLPASIIDTLKPGASTRHADTYRRASRQLVTMPSIIQGKQEITVRVKD